MELERRPYFRVILGGKQTPRLRDYDPQTTVIEQRKNSSQAGYHAYMHLRTYVYLRREVFNRTKALRKNIEDAEFFALYFDFIEGLGYCRGRNEEYLRRCAESFGNHAWMNGYCPKFLHDYIEDKIDVRRPENYRFFVALAAYVNERRPGYF